MSRPTDLDLTTAEQSWRQVPMPGANLGVDLVPLASAGETFALLVRFPAGFDRSTPGGYFCAEEFLVLDGSVELEERRYGRGDLTFIPSHFRRKQMVSSQGCTAIAWFGGPAVFRTEAELGDEAVTDGVESVTLDGLLGEDFLVTSEARWSVDTEATGPGEDGVDLELGRWWHGAGAAGSELVGLRRRPIVVG